MSEGHFEYQDKWPKLLQLSNGDKCQIELLRWYFERMLQSMIFSSTRRPRRQSERHKEAT